MVAADAIGRPGGLSARPTGSRKVRAASRVPAQDPLAGRPQPGQPSTWRPRPRDWARARGRGAHARQQGRHYRPGLPVPGPPPRGNPGKEGQADERGAGRREESEEGRGWAPGRKGTGRG